MPTICFYLCCLHTTLSVTSRKYNCVSENQMGNIWPLALDLNCSCKNSTKVNPYTFLARLYKVQGELLQSPQSSVSAFPSHCNRVFMQVFQKFISWQPLIRKLSYLDHRYTGGPACIPWLLTPWLMLRGWARGQNLRHLLKSVFLLFCYENNLCR